jgi:hypothetical protein
LTVITGAALVGTTAQASPAMDSGISIDLCRNFPLRYDCPTVTVKVTVTDTKTIWKPRRTVTKTVTLPRKTVTNTKRVLVTRTKTKVVHHRGKTRTKYVTLPRRTVHSKPQIYTKRVYVPPVTKTIERAVPGPTTTVRVTPPAKTRTIKAKSVVKTRNVTHTVHSVYRDAPVTLTKTEVVTLSSGLVVLGMVLAALLLWIAYASGNSYADARNRKQWRDFFSQNFHK